MLNTIARCWHLHIKMKLCPSKTVPNLTSESESVSISESVEGILLPLCFFGIERELRLGANDATLCSFRARMAFKMRRRCSNAATPRSSYNSGKNTIISFIWQNYSIYIHGFVLCMPMNTASRGLSVHSKGSHLSGCVSTGNALSFQYRARGIPLAVMALLHYRGSVLAGKRYHTRSRLFACANGVSICDILLMPSLIYMANEHQGNSSRIKKRGWPSTGTRT